MTAMDSREQSSADDILMVAIIGSGPAGLSAASRAAELQASHVLLEAENHASDTIHKYQKGKHVMAEPSVLPLQSGMSFSAGKREAVLDTWNRQLEEQGVNIRYGCRAAEISRGADGIFTIRCENGSEVRTTQTTK